MDSERDDVELSSTAEYTLSQACRFKAERDQLRQRVDALEEWSDDVESMYRDAFDKLMYETKKAKRLGKLVWRLQNRLARSHRRERNLRKGMREWREKAIDKPQVTMSAYDLLNEGEREVLRMWPRYEDGEPVRFGDRVKYRRGTCVVESVRFYIGGLVSVYGNDCDRQVVVTEPVFRDPVERVDADTWERIKADAATFVGHVTCRDMRREDAAETLREMMRLLYRCKALAERGE